MSRHSSTSWPGSASEEPFVLERASLELRVIAYGAIICSLNTPDAVGHVASVVLGHDRPDAYARNPQYLGAVVGRYANRIASARFDLDGDTYQLASNDGAHHLHGGQAGFDQQIWKAGDATRTAVTLTRVSPAGEEGYPGTVHASVTYSLTADNVVEIRYSATTDRATPLNLTQHTYFNLSGDPTASVLDHELTIDADRYHPVDATLIPDGAADSVDGTPFDFRRPRRLGDQLRLEHEALRRAGGFDHNWVLNRTDDAAAGQSTAPSLVHAARLRHPATGRVLDVATTEPGLQFYSGQWLSRGEDARFAPHSGLCLETQHFPNSPNRPDFPSTILRPGERYSSTTTWTFSVDRTDQGDS